MADEKKSNVTEVQAINSVLEFAIAAGYDDEDVIEKLNHMVEVRSRKRERKTDNSKTLANVALGEQFAEIWSEREDKTFKAADVAVALGVGNGKASAICRAMKWEKVPTTDKTNTYTL